MTAGESFAKYPIPHEVERRERALGCFTARFVQGLPEDLKATAFCGPASFRDPEADDIWHTYIIRSGFPALVKNQGLLLARAFIGGIRRFVLGRFGSFTFVSRDQSNVLGIGPINICKPTSNGVETTYCHPEDTNAMAWLIFDDEKRDPEGYPLSRFIIPIMYVKMFLNWFRVSCFYRGDNSRMDWVVGIFLTARWILSLVWVNKWMLALKIRQVLEKRRTDWVYCVHEMHPHSRIAWAEARRHNIPSITIQHASIVRTKLWYFPTREELETGLATPNEMAVFSEQVRGLLEPFFPEGSRYPLTCGPRFSKWKKMKRGQHHKKNGEGPILFAGSLPWWDNVVILKGVKRLLSEGHPRRQIQVRLHPAARMTVQWKKWLDHMVKEGKVTLSTGPLEDAIENCDAVVGMNTTVLEEGALMGKAVLVLEDRDYLSFSTQLGEHIPLERFSWYEVEKAIVEAFGGREETIHEGRVLLGIDHPVYRICHDQSEKHS